MCGVCESKKGKDAFVNDEQKSGLKKRFLKILFFATEPGLRNKQR